MTAPVLISQLNSLPLAGIDGRRFLQVVRQRQLPHGRVGKLVFVDAEVLRGALLVAAVAENTDSTHVEDEEPQSVDDVLRLIGREAAS